MFAVSAYGSMAADQVEYIGRSAATSIAVVTTRYPALFPEAEFPLLTALTHSVPAAASVHVVDAWCRLHCQ